MPLRVGNLVIIQWEDSYGCSSHWQEIPDAHEPAIVACRSIGWVTAVSKRCVVIVPHLAESDAMGIRSGMGDLTIPRSAILSATEIKLPTSTASSSAAATGRSRQRS